MLRSRYFCAGTVRDRLRSVGFPRVINQNRDFYRDAEAVPPLIPAYDVLVSNPVRNGTTHPQPRTQIVEKEAAQPAPRVAVCIRLG